MLRQCVSPQPCAYCRQLYAPANENWGFEMKRLRNSGKIVGISYRGIAFLNLRLATSPVATHVIGYLLSGVTYDMDGTGGNTHQVEMVQ